MSKWEIKVDKSGTGVSGALFKVQVTGIIDEDTDFRPFDLNGASTVEINIDGVKSINSCGIREWIKWISTAGGATIQYQQCPKVIVDQINMVQGFLPQQGQVSSFYVPYYSEETDEEKSILFTNGKEFNELGLLQKPTVNDSKGNAMDMDVIESKYFKFLKKA